MKLSHTQNSFIAGELNPLATSRADIAQYQNGLKRAENTMILPQGGIIKRWGTRLFHSTIDRPNTHNPIVFGDLFAVPFDFGDDNDYLIIFEVVSSQKFLELHLLKNDKVAPLDFYIPSLLPRDTSTQGGWDQFNGHDLSYSQFGDTIIICHKMLRPFKLTRMLVTATSGYAKGETRERWKVSKIDFDAIPKHEFTIGKPEPAWSDERGWPETCCFHENRLFLAATKSLPQTIWGSKNGIYYDFTDPAPDQIKDTDAVSATLVTNSLNYIKSIYSSRHLILFTTGGQWYLDEKPLTPKNFSNFARHSEYEASGLKPTFVEEGLVFHQNGSNNIRLFRWDADLDDFVSTSLSYLGGHLIKDPVSLAATKNLNGGGGNYIFVVNSDGTMAVCNLDLYQGSLSWVKWTSGVHFKKVIVSGSKVYFHMHDPEKAAHYITQLDPNYYFDLCVKKSTSTYDANVITVPTDLANQLVDVLFGQVYIADQLVNNIGKISLHDVIPAGYFLNANPGENPVQHPRTVEWQAGLAIKMTIESLPLAINHPTLGNIGRLKKRLNRVYLKLQDSVLPTIYYNGQEYYQGPYPGYDIIKNLPPKISGIQKYDLLGISEEATITIKQRVPHNFNLLAISQDFSIG